MTPPAEGKDRWKMQKVRTAGCKRAAARLGACLMAAVLFSGIGTGRGAVSYGADSSVVESLTVTLKSTFGEPEEILEPEISINGKGCTLGDVQFRTDYDRWKPGKKVRVEITVNADEGKVFPVSLNRSKCKVQGADFVSAKALDDNTLQVKVDYKPVAVLGDTTEAGWSSSRRRAVWKAVEYAPGYSLVLYGDNKVIKRITVDGANSCNLTEYIDDVDKTYYYEVKAIPITSEEKKYLKEGSFITSSDQEFDADDWENWNNGSSGGGSSGTSSSPGNSAGSGAGPGNGANDGGAIRGNNYILPDGRKAADTWKKVSSQWYYFDQNGNMARGWRNIGGFWYYMDGNGVMQTGWVNPSGDSWYYLGNNGDMCTGWIQPRQGEWYYLDGSGLMRRYWVQLDGKWYFMDQSGRMLTGWITVEGKNYFLYSDGSMAADTTVSGRQLGADGAEIR